MLDQHLRILCRLSKRHDSGSKQIRRLQLEGVENVKPAHDVWHELLGGLVVVNVIAQQLVVFFLELQTRERIESIVELLGVEKFTRGRGSQLEALRRLDFVQLLENLVALRFLRMAEDVKTPKPAREREASEQQDEDRPREKIVPFWRRCRGVVVAPEIVVHGWNRRWSRCGCGEAGLVMVLVFGRGLGLKRRAAATTAG